MELHTATRTYCRYDRSLITASSASLLPRGRSASMSENQTCPSFGSNHSGTVVFGLKPDAELIESNAAGNVVGSTHNTTVCNYRCTFVMGCDRIEASSRSSCFPAMLTVHRKVLETSHWSAATSDSRVRESVCNFDTRYCTVDPRRSSVTLRIRDFIIMTIKLNHTVYDPYSTTI